MPGKHTPPIDENMLRQVEELAGYGLTLGQIAAVLGFSERTLHNKKTEELVAAIRRGKSKASAIVGKALFTRAKEGDVPAIRWWEMTRDGRSERAQTDSRVEVMSDAETDARLARILGQAADQLQAGHSPDPDT